MMFQDIQIIAADDLCTRKDARRRKNRRTIADFWIFIPPKGDIELPLFIDTVKPVKTCLVEEDHPCSRLCWRQLLPIECTHLIETLASILILLQICDDLLCIRCDFTVHIDELRIAVRKNSVLRLQREKQCPAAKKRLNVFSIVRRHLRTQIPEQLRLPACPL